jgi:murE/murF fusion protein
MHLGNLLKSTSKNYRKIPVKGISFDSRKIKRKDIFFAIRGNKTSGTNFINDAISRGASAIVSSKKIKYKNRQIPLLLVKDVRKSLAEASSNFYKRKPSNIIAVTGTNGKSSVANFFYQILSFNKISAA